MGTLISSNALTDSKRRLLFLKRRYDLDIRSGLNGMRICASRGRCPWVSNPGAGLLGVGRVDTVRGVRPSP